LFPSPVRCFAAFTAGRVAEAAASVGAHIVLLAGDQHILDAIAKHLPGPFGPITTIASGPVPEDGDERLGAQITTALDEITGEAVSAVGTWFEPSCAHRVRPYVDLGRKFPGTIAGTTGVRSRGRQPRPPRPLPWLACSTGMILPTAGVSLPGTGSVSEHDSSDSC